jgi:hypothetical protein
MAAARAADMRPGDIVPALDVEADPVPTMQQVSPAWEPKVRRMAEALTVAFGAQCLIYITQREWGMLGKPYWVLDYPLWCAHYTGASRPATPGGIAPAIWQHRVGPYNPNGPGGHFDVPGTLQLDQNRSFGPLPLAKRVPWEDSAPRPFAPDDEADDGAEALALTIAARSAVDATLDDAREAMLDDADTDPAPPMEEDDGQ